MPNYITIAKEADLAPALERILEAPNEEFIPEVSPDLVFTIKLKGRTWDGLVDARVAAYVTELQRTFDRARRETAGPDVERELVKVRVVNGSTDLEARGADLFTELIRNMNGNQQFVIVIVVVGCTFLGWSLLKVLGHLKDRQAAQLGHDTQTHTVKEMGESLRFALEKIDPEKPVRTLIKGMESADTIKLPDVPEPLTRDEAKARYPRKPRVTPIDVLIDDNYHVAAVALAQPVSLTLVKGDISFKAEFAKQLQGEDRDEFLARVKAAIETGDAMRVALHIDARVNDVSLVHAVIVGIGKAPRDGSQDIAEILD